MITDITLTGGAGEYMDSATLVEWRAKAGDRVEAGALLAVVETAKAATEIEAPASGFLTGPLAEIGAEIAVGTVLGRISDHSAAEAEATEAQVAVAASAASPAAPASAREGNAGRLAASPLARRLAGRRGIDLGTIAGSGPGGRIKSRDLPPEIAPAALVPAPQPPRFPLPPRSVGQGDPRPLLVLLHGFGANRLAWSGLIPRLAGAARVLALDLPAHGRNLSAALSLDAIAGELCERVEAEDALSVHLVGHSLGGAVAARIAAMGRLPLASLTLIAPAGLGPEIDGAFLAGFSRAREVASLSPWLGRLVADPAVLPPGFAAAVLKERAENGLAGPQERLSNALFPDGTQGFAIGPDLARLQVPAKVIWGLCDRIIPPAHGLTLPASVALHRVEGVGHMPSLESPDLTARLVAETIRAGAFAA